jgi:cytidine deaminase
MPTPFTDHPGLALLTRTAWLAADNAYSPYSQFRVGAAALTRDGTIVTGANIENASYGLTNCAERSALFAAYSNGHREITALCVACPDVVADDIAANPGLVMPCGACRQVMRELLAPDAPIGVVGVGVYTIDELLPQAFSLRPPS